VFNTDVTGLLQTIGNQDSSADQIQAAIGEAFAIFTGAADPLLNGEGAAFNPNRFGFLETDLVADGEVRNITIQFLRASTIAGTVLNGQGVPIGARVRLTGIGPAGNGMPTTVLRGERNSDPALGTFAFERQAFIGSYGLQAASPFFPIVITASGFTSEIQPDDTNVVLQFPAAREVNGRLAGLIFDPDGSPAAEGVKVRIKSMDLEIQTRTNGFFDTQIALPATQPDGTLGKGYFVEAEDLVTGARGAAGVTVLPGLTNQVNIRLVGRGGLQVTVLQNDGTPAAGALVDFSQGSYPQDHGQLPADGGGLASFLNLFEGSYSVSAQFVTGPTTLSGRVGVSVQADAISQATIRLGPTATIQGFFMKRDLVTPVGFAQIAVGDTGFASTDSNGFFRVGGLPLGTYRLTSHEPVSGIGAVLVITLAFNGQTNNVTLTEQARGELRGAVVASDGLSLVPSVNVTLRVSDGITSDRTVTTGPDGRYSFPGVPAGPFELTAFNPVNGLAGSSSSVLPETAASFEINVPLQPLATLAVRVFRPDGITPATNATVVVKGLALVRSADTDPLGAVRFGDLPLQSYEVLASSRELEENRSAGRQVALLGTAGQTVQSVVVLAGVGQVNGQVLLSDGITPATNAEVNLELLGPLVRDTLVGNADESGQFAFANVPVGPFAVRARSGPLGARAEGSIAQDGDAQTVNLVVEASGTVAGRLVRADAVTPVAGEDVQLIFPGRSIPGALFRTGVDGRFAFTSVPLGGFRLQSVALGFNGIALLDSSLNANGETNDVGNLTMDEDDPHVVSVFPTDTSVGVPITTQVELLFNEPLRSNSVDATGIYLQGPSNTVAASVQLLADTNGQPRLVRLVPLAPLTSLVTYRVVVVDGERRDALGAIIGQGPQDRGAGRWWPPFWQPSPPRTTRRLFCSRSFRIGTPSRWTLEP
jgi:hypothetical protein